MIGVSLMSLAIIFFISRIIKNTKSRVAAITIIFCFGFIKIYEGYSAFELIYSFFNTPSMLCITICIYFIIAESNNIYKANKHHNIFNQYSFIVLCIYGGILYLGTLNLIPFDLYYLETKYQAIAVLFMASIIICIDKAMGLCITLSLIAFMLSKKQSITESILDPYLWIYSLAYSTYIITLSLIKNIKNATKGKK